MKIGKGYLVLKELRKELSRSELMNLAYEIVLAEDLRNKGDNPELLTLFADFIRYNKAQEAECEK